MQVLEQIKYKKNLDHQLDEKQDKLNQLYQDFLKEKAVIDSIIADVKAEQRNKVIQVLVKKQVAKEEIQHFIQSQKVFVQLEQDRIERENEEIKAYIAGRDAWVTEQNKIMDEKRVLKHDQVQALGQKLEAERQAEAQKEALLHELNEGRQRDLDKVKDRHELELEVRKRLDFRRCNDLNLSYKARLKAMEKAEDEAWKARIMAEAEKEAKLEQMSQAKRRMKMLELKREADRLLSERQKEREIQNMEEKLYWASLKAEEEEREALIEEERRKLLEEHAEKLMGFLPHGVLSEEDFERLGLKDIRFLYKK